MSSGFFVLPWINHQKVCTKYEECSVEKKGREKIHPHHSQINFFLDTLFESKTEQQYHIFLNKSVTLRLTAITINSGIFRI